MSSDACMPWASFLALSTNHSPGVWTHLPVESASFHSETVQRLPMSLSKVSAMGVGASAAFRGVGGVLWRRAGEGRVAGSSRARPCGVSHRAHGARQRRRVCERLLQPCHAMQRVRGASRGVRNSPSKNTLALADASASAVTSRLIISASSTCNARIGRCAAAECRALISAWSEVLRDGCPGSVRQRARAMGTGVSGIRPACPYRELRKI